MYPTLGVGEQFPSISLPYLATPVGQSIFMKPIAASQVLEDARRATEAPARMGSMQEWTTLRASLSIPSRTRCRRVPELLQGAQHIQQLVLAHVTDCEHLVTVKLSHGNRPGTI